MARFRKKPVVIDAIQWTGKNVAEVQAFLGNDLHDINAGGVIFVVSNEGIVSGPEFMWVMRGVKGEHYLCAPEIFAATYDAVEEPLSV